MVTSSWCMRPAGTFDRKSLTKFGFKATLLCLPVFLHASTALASPADTSSDRPTVRNVSLGFHISIAGLSWKSADLSACAENRNSLLNLTNLARFRYCGNGNADNGTSEIAIRKPSDAT